MHKPTAKKRLFQDVWTEKYGCIENAYLQIETGDSVVQFSGVAIATVMAIVLNLILPQESVSEKQLKAETF